MIPLKEIFSNTFSQVLSRVLSSATGFLITILVARHFGIAGYSDLAKITALVTLFYLGVDLGANAIFLQFEKQHQNLQDLLSFRLLLAGILFVATSLIVWVLPYNMASTSGYSPFVKIGIIFFAFSYFSRAVVYTCTAFFQQNLSYPKAAMASVVGSVVTLFLVGITVVTRQSILWIVGAYLLGGFAEASVSLWFARKALRFLVLPSPLFVKKIFWETLPLTVLLFLNLLYFRTDMIILSVLQKSSAVGLYDFAYKFFDFLIALPLFLSNTLYPSLLIQEKNYRIQRTNTVRYTFLFFGLGLLLVPMVYFFAPLIALVKPVFTPSVAALRVLSLSLPIFFATSILQWIFIAKKKQKMLVVVYGVSLVLNVLLNIIFIPKYSFLASAVITDVSEFFILGIMLLLFFLKTI